MDTQKRIDTYVRQNGRAKLTHRQRRRVVKNAGRDPRAAVIRDDGMGYPASMQGFRELIGISPAPLPAPVSGVPVQSGTGRGHKAVEAWIDEEADEWGPPPGMEPM